MKIGLITTLNTNIGDDFIREGICYVLRKFFKGHEITFVSVNKHEPYTVYPAGHLIHLRDLADHLPLVNRTIKSAIESVSLIFGSSSFDDCDLIVQCGAPVFWPNCSKNEWAKPLWHDVVGRLCNKIPTLNLAAGSCYPWECQPEQPESADDMDYIKSILGYCRLTSVRDRLAGTICKSVGKDVPTIPCTAFLAARHRKQSVSAESGYILINYMVGSGHFDWNQGVDPKQWENTIKQTITSLGKRHTLAFLCHDEKEFALAQNMGLSLPIFFPKTPEEYFDCVAGAKFGIFNRMHASVGMAGLGIPSVAVCTDTRLLMVSELGLPVHYVKDIHAEILEEETERLLKTPALEHNRLLALQEATLKRYLSAIDEVLS